MSTEIAVRTHGSLTITPDQTWWTEEQTLVLRQAGVDDDVTEAELRGFLHICQRTGLDPFTRQIYLIGRFDKKAGRKVFTPQTAIDGYRVVRDRVIERTHGTLSYDDALWCGPDGEWRDVWVDDATPPVATKITVYRDGGRYSAIAKYSEYVQKNSYGVTSMWAKMPAGQLAKCGEALALRKAFPHDLAGVYTSEEMAQADNPGAEQQPQRQTARQVEDDPWQRPAPVQRSRPAAAEPEDAEVVGEQPGPALATQMQLDELNGGLRALRGVGSAEAWATALTSLLGRPVAAEERLTRPDVERALSALRKEDEANAKQRQQEEREAARAAEAAAPFVSPPATAADRQEVDWILGGLTAVRGITDPQSKRVAIEYMIGDEMPDPYRMTAEQAASVRATLEAEYAASQQQGPAESAKPEEKRRRALHAAFKKAGIDDHTERIAYAGLVIGEPFVTTSDLDAAELERVVEALNAGRTIDSFPVSERAAQLKSMIASATTSDNLAEVSERFWSAFEAVEITEVERDVLMAASARRERELAQMAGAAA